MRNQISALILKINSEIELIKTSYGLSDEEKAEATEYLSNAKKGLREAKYYIGLAQIHVPTVEVN